MLKEEKELRKVARALYPFAAKRLSIYISALVRAVREDCAKFADSVHDTAGVGKQIAEGIRGKK